MIKLFWQFFKIGLFSFGGSYTAIPLMYDVMIKEGWLSSDMLSHIIAVSESTPGPIMVNLAGYVGSLQGGLLGSFIATFAVTLPAFLIILMLFKTMNRLVSNRLLDFIMQNLSACVVAIILEVGLFMLYKNIGLPQINPKGLLIFALIGAFSYLFQKWRKKTASPIAIIAVSAFLGMLLF